MAKPNKQTDFVRTPADVAIAIVKDFQAGKAGTGQVREALADLGPDDLTIVGIGTRLNSRSLTALKG